MTDKNKKNTLTCPSCNKEFIYEGLEKNKAFPFCSKRCKMIDLGRWLDDEYRIECAQDNLEDEF